MSGDGFILASASPRRLQLLAQIGLAPDCVEPADINEDPIPGELPGPHARRLATEKAAIVSQRFAGRVVLAADTVVGVGRRILPKTMDRGEAEDCLRLMSGRAHRVFTGVCVVDANGVSRSKLSETRLKVKRLSDAELNAYLDSGEWHGKAGGYGIQGRAGAFIPFLSGSYTGVVGLPVYETAQMLKTAGVSL
ncbi:Maf family protein [uncultured Algimonas sp.]|uniref:Maf family protein n=1 Tax=uncultured Algimonas sp. TaxID=1547920 RepID=UPI00263176FE|nr:Maf family protein [uncultured Algimonas sp.]